MVATAQTAGSATTTDVRRLLDMGGNGILSSEQRQYQRGNHSVPCTARRGSTVADTPKVRPESRMLIDGKLVDADSGKTFTNVNPATEEALGEVADASAAEMGRAITAARRAFDETRWATDRAFRKRCLQQLQDALDGEREELREQLILEVGTPRMLTDGPQL